VETFCAAKPQNGDLQTVERTKCAVLERLVITSRKDKPPAQTKMFDKTQSSMLGNE
jgi:hypothetical protein